MKKAFTMIELIFVIVVIGILSAIAVPKFAATRDDAVISKAKNTIASVRSAMATERQRRILRGDFNAITDLADTNGADNLIFDEFENNTTVLQYPLRACKNGAARGCWISAADNTYQYRMPHNANNVVFTLGNNLFTCLTTGATGPDCKLLTE